MLLQLGFGALTARQKCQRVGSSGVQTWKLGRDGPLLVAEHSSEA